MGRPSAWTLVSVDKERHRVLAPKAVAADILGANRSWMSSASIPPAAEGLYDLAEVARKFIEYREGVARRAGEKAAQDESSETLLKLERLRLLNEKTALDNRAKMGELVNVDELGQVWTRAFAGFRSALEVIPRKLAAAHDVDSGVERELARLIDDALRELAGLELGDGEGAGAAGDADVA